MPIRSSPPLPISTIEWIPSDNIAELPEMEAAINFVTAIAKFAPIAPYTAILDSAIKKFSALVYALIQRHAPAEELNGLDMTSGNFDWFQPRWTGGTIRWCAA